jgi:precorrin-6B C5,15-methyltransferase / cobalt-precorrin-6B C5,C15-methyltransferase
VLNALRFTVSAEEPAAVLVTGDPGYFGLLRSLRAKGVAADVLPSVASVARLAAFAKRPWDDVVVVSARGHDFGRAVNVCRARPAVAVLTAPGAGPAELAAALTGWRRTMMVLEDADGPRERLSVVDASAAGSRNWQDPMVVLCVAEPESVGGEDWLAGGAAMLPEEGWALDEDAFAHRDGAVSGPELRAIALAKLAPRAGMLLWDVAAGSGALGVEAGRLGAAVVAIEHDPGLCVRIIANASRYGVDVRLVEAQAPAGLAELPRPDSVFIGEARPDVVRACAGVGATRIVVVVHEVAGVGPAADALRDAGYHVQGCQLSSARLAGFDDERGARLSPATPDFLLWAVRR